jgi:uncharacterized sporulation protein YeaH/YhbH (DUF444 family)
MPQLIDRRLNPRDKSLGNRQRFLKRTRAQIKQAVDKAVNDRNIAEGGKGGKIAIASKGIGEPRFHHQPGSGDRQWVLPGNREFVAGDEIDKPQGGQGSGGKDASSDGDGEDDFAFAISEDEFLDILFEDLELPDLFKVSLKDSVATEPRRAGFTNSGTTPNLNVLRTMRNSFGRRVALGRPSAARIAELEAELKSLETEGDLDIRKQARLVELYAEIDLLQRRRRSISWIDPLDIRYNRFERQPVPKAKAVMFCLMDVSGSMGEHEKDLAKRFFLLLHLFLKRKYQRVDLVFIRHTHSAKEVDEKEFFHSRETGGTVVSTALVEMLEVVRKRYDTAEWNIYAAQASDGDNLSDDNERCVDLLQNEVLPLCQYFAYVEILSEREIEQFTQSGDGKDLWQGYAGIGGTHPNFAMRHVARRADIWPVFRELFTRQTNRSEAP